MSPRRWFSCQGLAKADFQPLVQVGNLLEMVRQHIEIVFNIGENFRVRPEGNSGPMAGSALALDDFAGRYPLGVFLVMDVTLPVNLGLQVRREAVHDGTPDAVQTAGYLVSAAAELAAGMEGGHYRLQPGLTGGGMNVDRNTPAVV